jgi:hypothetical protein
MRTPGFHIALDSLAGSDSILMVHLCGGVWPRLPDLSYSLIVPCAKAIPTAALPWRKPRCVCALSSSRQPQPSTTPSLGSHASKSFVSPHTWLMLSTLLRSSMVPPPEHSRCICTVLACLSRSCTPMQARSLGLSFTISPAPKTGRFLAPMDVCTVHH